MNYEIEQKRLHLIETAKKFGMNAEETIRCSQELDTLLNKGIKTPLKNARIKGKPYTSFLSSKFFKKTITY
ncbi:aspartyl-phosphate phosphatase Spo0E family protein [Bacillus altitudinis]|nr:aspartyl-phosphate phosphatase Spo0E family protein [Bacillus altitudinis]WEZ73236.1 aspartyl-phosphate phosphatase Spo0E family protein [Bacillus altitudinis]